MRAVFVFSLLLFACKTPTPIAPTPTKTKKIYAETFWSDHQKLGAEQCPNVASGWQDISKEKEPIDIYQPTNGALVWTGENVLYASVNSSLRISLFEPCKNQWTSPTSKDMPSGDYQSLRLHWTGEELLIWEPSIKGKSGSGVFFDPIRRTWNALPMPNAPGEYTGTQMLWMDKRAFYMDPDSGADFKTAKYYDFSTGKLLKTPQENTPLLRIQNSFFEDAPKNYAQVWTGEVLLIWGGSQNGNIALNDGAMFNPETNSWTKIASEGAPSPREYPSFTWTGEELLIWGGRACDRSSCTWLEDGARFSPKTNTWRPLSTKNAPSARHSPLSQWTGTHWVLYGGKAPLKDPSAPFEGGFSGAFTKLGGASYDPAKDEWTPIQQQKSFSQFEFADVFSTMDGNVVFSVHSEKEAALAVLQPNTGEWVFDKDSRPLEGRSGGVSVWTGHRVLLLGGSTYKQESQKGCSKTSFLFLNCEEPRKGWPMKSQMRWLF
jgi:hypothetical protein